MAFEIRPEEEIAVDRLVMASNAELSTEGKAAAEAAWTELFERAVTLCVHCGFRAGKEARSWQAVYFVAKRNDPTGVAKFGVDLNSGPYLRDAHDRPWNVAGLHYDPVRKRIMTPVIPNAFDGQGRPIRRDVMDVFIELLMEIVAIP
jgi:hypothetical protein